MRLATMCEVAITPEAFVCERNQGVNMVAYGQIITGMPNLRKNPFCTDFQHLFQSTDKKLFYERIYGFFSCSVRLLPPDFFRLLPDPIALSRLAVFRAPRVNFFRLGLLPPPPIGFRNLRIFRNFDWATL